LAQVFNRTHAFLNALTRIKAWSARRKRAMQHALRTRAASLCAATVFVGAAIYGAVNLRSIVFTPITLDLPPIVSVDEPTPPPPEPETIKETPPAPPLEGPIVEDISLFPVEPIADAPPTFTELPVIRAFGPVEITRPTWERRPEDVARFYPERAIRRGVEGQVRLDCLVTVGGALNCRIIEETPRNWGFGEAALSIAREYRMAPALRDGVPVEGRYRMVVPFNLG
jgi:protein TonB